jgi:nucleoside-diphosphate-sugar epimerase
MRTALVTGGAGFIGSHLVSRLLGQGWRVRVLDNLSSGVRENLPPHGDLEILEGDIRDYALCHRACERVDSVFHMAAIASVASSVDDPVTSHDVNITGTLNVLMAARDEDVRRFVFSSSAAVYGNADKSPTDEEQPLKPQSPYATGKASGEMYCRNFWDLYGLEVVVLRYFNVFGPRQSTNSGYAAVIPAFVQAAVESGVPVVYGDGLQTRDFVYVDNVVAANIRAALAPGIAGKTLNVAGGEGISLLSLLSALERISATRLKPAFKPARAGEVRHSCADISQARSAMGYEPLVSYTTGLERTLEAARMAHDSSLSPV